MEHKDISLLIQNLVQFYSLKHGVDKLISLGYSIDIFVPKGIDNSGMGDIFDNTFTKLKEMGYSPLREPKNSIHYHILLEPYHMDEYFKFNYTYRIKFKYSLLSAKPNLVYTPEANIIYDAILCFSKYDAEFLKVYSNTELIGNLKYLNYEKQYNKNTTKPTLLYLPTYGEVSSIDDICSQLKKLKSKYYIITKLHHGTSFLKNEDNRISLLEELSDECYDHATPLIELLSKADVVLSDNSGAIFESLYAKVPLAICSKNINANKLENFDTIQYKLVQDGIIPFSETPSEIENILEKALSDEYKNKQLSILNELFYYPEEPISHFVKIIEKYLKDNINLEYKKFHDILIKNFLNKDLLINKLNTELIDKENKINIINTEICDKNTLINNLNTDILKYQSDLLQAQKALQYYENGKLYKLCKKIYKIKNKE